VVRTGFLNRWSAVHKNLRVLQPPRSRNLSLPKLTLHSPPPHHDQGTAFPLRGSSSNRAYWLTILQVNFVCAVSVPVGGAHEETFKGYGT